MKIILLILLLPLAKCALPRISFSCFLLGDWGCEVKCNIKCLLLGCVARGKCDGWSHCGCNELYSMGETILTNDDFENLDFAELWSSIFEANDASAKVLKRVRKDDDLEKFLIKLLRDTYMTGDDIISLLKQEYPNWKTVNSLISLQHGLKTEIMEPGKHINYDDLDANLKKLMDLIKIIPPDDMENSQHKLRVKNLLRNITAVEDLEEILYLIKLSGNQNLYRLAKSSLKNLKYGFEEDGDSPAGKKAILKNISVDLEDANDDEKLEVAVTKKFMPTKSTSTSETKKKIFHAEDGNNLFTQGQTPISTRDDHTSVKNVVPTAPTPAAAPPTHVPYGKENSLPWKPSGSPIAANNAHGNSHWNSIGYNGYGNPVTGFEANTISNVGPLTDANTSASKVFVVVVDANGNIIRTNEMTEKRKPPPIYGTNWID